MIYSLLVTNMIIILNYNIYYDKMNFISVLVFHDKEKKTESFKGKLDIHFIELEKFELLTIKEKLNKKILGIFS